MKENVPRLVLISTVAHEMGHIYDLEDEYCSNQAGSKDPRCNDAHQQWNIGPQFFSPTDINYLDPNPPFYCDAREGGTCCEDGAGLLDCDPGIYILPSGKILTSLTGYHVCCRGNYNSKGGITAMSFSNAHEVWSENWGDSPRGYDAHSLAYLNTIPQLKCN